MRFKLKEVWEEHIRRERAKPGGGEYNLTYRKLAKKAGVPIRSIQRIEENENTTTDTLERIAKALGVKVADLIEDE